MEDLSFLEKYRLIEDKIIIAIIFRIQILFTIIGIILVPFIAVLWLTKIIQFISKIFPGWILWWDFSIAIITFWSIAIFWFITYYIIFWICRLFVINPIRKVFIKNVDWIISLHKVIEESIQIIQTIDEILIKLNEVYLLHKKLILIRNIIEFTGNDTYIELNRTIKKSLSWSISIITNLQNDLTLRLTEQQKALEWAKSDVEMNIAWTPELNGVSELQKARLDRQIEQFEELQKVLMKV